MHKGEEIRLTKCFVSIDLNPDRCMWYSLKVPSSPNCTRSNTIKALEHLNVFNAMFQNCCALGQPLSSFSSSLKNENILSDNKENIFTILRIQELIF